MAASPPRLHFISLLAMKLSFVLALLGRGSQSSYHWSVGYWHMSIKCFAKRIATSMYASVHKLDRSTVANPRLFKQEWIWKCLITESFALYKTPWAFISVVALAPYRFLVHARPCVCLYLAQAIAQRWEGSRVLKFYIVQGAVWLQMRSRICKKFKTWCY